MKCSFTAFAGSNLFKAKKSDATIYKRIGFFERLLRTALTQT